MPALHIEFLEIAVSPGGAIRIDFGAPPVPGDGYVEPDPVRVERAASVTRDGWQAGARTGCRTSGGWQAAGRVGRVDASAYGSAGPVFSACGSAWEASRRTSATLSSAYQAAAQVAEEWVAVWESSVNAVRAWRAVSASASARQTGWGGAWQSSESASSGLAGGWSASRRKPHRIAQRWQPAARAMLRTAGAWEPARRPPFGRWSLPPGPVTPPGCYTPPPGGQVHVVFAGAVEAFDGHIVFRCGESATPGPVVVPILRAYIVINSATLTRVSNGLPIHVTGPLRIAIDADSAHWTWSASVPLRALADLEPNLPGELVELEATVNGNAWRLLVESRREAERFGSASLQIGGRGLAAEIADPAWPVISRDNVSGAAMAQQLAAAALMINGVPIGWNLDWQAADWLIPPGAWVHAGTPLQAVARIAEAAGAYVQPAAGARTLRVLPRYPVAPWEWDSASPAVIMPADAVLERGAEHITRADYNAVYVSGEEGGVLARIKRAGSAGDRAAQMVVDRLVTHPDAARGRGLAVLGNTGAQQLLTLETGILPASGVIHVGTLMDWTRGADTRRGLVRSLSVTASPSSASSGPLIVRQTLGVETHG